jgi:isoleucyl-tRNA synthetase
MPFEKVETQVDFPALERQILAFWDDIRAFEKRRELNQGKPKWSFLDGPITANNPMGVHHAWGRTYKDAYNRYFAMTGHELRYQNGFDCQGLWVEVEVEKELKLKSKRDIENLVPGDRFASIDKFVHECKARVNTFARKQTDQSIRLGYWMDWDRTDADWAKDPGQRKSYFTMSDENNYTIWSFLKKCHDRKLVYKSYDAMPWCGRCGTGISQQEMNEGYQLVAHRSVFVKFPLRAGSVSDGRDANPVANASGSENLLVWTTTPWTLSSNVAAAVNPKLTYLKVEHKDEIYYVAKGAFTAHRLEEQFKRKEWVEGVPKLKTLEQIFKEKGGYEIRGEVPGSSLVGRPYNGPFDELEAQNQPSGYPDAIARVVRQQNWGPAKSAKEIHRVVAWEDVGESEGTGIVHIAPGCGAEDFHLGKEQGLVPIAPLDDSGIFLAGFGELAGKSANDHATTDWILENLHKKGALFAVEKYPHSYPHCWRCKTELLFRLVDEWFIDMKWRDEIMRVTEQVTFLPESVNGKARELDWLRNMGDWMISKKRFWGLALPIWVDEESGDFEVIGSYAELKQRAVEGWDKFEGHPPHRPWVDLIKIRNPKTGNLMSRIGDVGNPWLDAGIVPYSTVKFNSDHPFWEKWFPADFITESFPGQFRNWFYSLLAMSTMMTGRTPFKVLLGHALVRDQKGDEMHKSKGNAIPFEGAVDTGYELFHERDAKQKPEAQAARDLPDGWIEGTVQEKTITLNNKPISVVTAKYPPMSADLMRWMYCRQPPAQNINFGPHLAEEVRSKVHLKLWNTYAFFCNYARLDNFDPASPQVPMAERPDIDRWILSDLQELIKTARTAFEAYDVMAFCLAAESFIDDKLSNWYVRRNRRRFWKSEQGEDKQAAYQTLYTVLLTLTKLIAPISPFIAEVMYQNLVQGGADTGDMNDGGRDVEEVAEGEAYHLDHPESVHLCDFPVVDESLVDAQLSQDMDALLGIVSLGQSVRQAAKIKVRQPLAELVVQPGTEADRRAVERFADQILEELNIKSTRLHAETRPLLSFELKINPKVGGPKFGAKMPAVQAALQKTDDAVVLLQAGKSVTVTLPDGASFVVEPGDVWITPKVEKGFTGLVDRTTQLLLDGRITPDLAREGMAREVIRHVQNSRKEAGLQAEDRIVLLVETPDAELGAAIEAHWYYIANETLSVERAKSTLDDGAFRAEVKVDGKPLSIGLRKK